MRYRYGMDSALKSEWVVGSREVWLFLTVAALWISSPAYGVDEPQMLTVAWNDSSSSSGGIVGISSEAPWGPLTGSLAIGRGATLRSANGRVFAVSPTDNRITIISIRPWAIEADIALSPGSDPIDIAIVNSSLAYVTQRGGTHLLRVDLDTFQTQPVVDLSTFADSDGVPDMAWMAVHEGRLFVQLQRFSMGDPFGFIPPAMIAVVDLASEQLIDVDPIAPGVQAIELFGTAAKQKMQIVPSARRLYVSASGAFFDAGGLEAIDLDSLQSLGLILRESDGKIGADLGSFVLVRPDRGFLVFSTDLILSSHLVDFDVGGFVGSNQQIHAVVDYRVPTMLHDRRSDVLFFPEGGFMGDGIHVFDATDHTMLTSGLLPIPGQPTDIAFACDAMSLCGDPNCPGNFACADIPILSPLGMLWMSVGIAGAAIAVLMTRARSARRHS